MRKKINLYKHFPWLTETYYNFVNCHLHLKISHTFRLHQILMFASAFVNS